MNDLLISRVDYIIHFFRKNSGVFRIFVLMSESSEQPVLKADTSEAPIVLDPEAEKKEILKRYKALLKACKPNIDASERKMIRKAFDLSLEAHKDMRRKSGEPYIFHPIAVAMIVAEEIGLGAMSIVCALLHDVVEDTHYSLEDLEKLFNKKVAFVPIETEVFP